MPQIDQSIALAGCFVTCAAYAAILSTKRGRVFTVKQTWLTVVVGVLIVLGWMAAVDIDAALLALAFFVAGGLPLIVRSWWLNELYKRGYINHLQNELENERRRYEDLD